MSNIAGLLELTINEKLNPTGVESGISVGML